MRRVAVLTGSRAEYGLLRWLMEEISRDPDLRLQTVVTGMHLSPEFGLTYRQIEADGFEIDERVDILLSGDSPAAIARSIGLGTIGFADAFRRLSPDVLVVLGDRFEVLAAAQAALVARLPVAHIHGGETTEGAFDEAIRHAVTKMSHFHFVATGAHARRVIQMGEDPDRVFPVGAPGLDNLERLDLLARDELSREIGLAFESPAFLVTYHPATLSEKDPSRGVEALLEALDRFPDADVLFTLANADPRGRIVNRKIREFAAEHPDRARAFPSLGQVRYLSAMKHADLVVGNSSSGLIEAPSLGTPTVDVGERQRGRARAASVIECREDADAIEGAIQTALSPSHRERAATADSPYGGPGASGRIKELLTSVELDGVLMKRFHDLDVEAG